MTKDESRLDWNQTLSTACTIIRNLIEIGMAMKWT